MFELLLAGVFVLSLTALYQQQMRRSAERMAESWRQAAHNARDQSAELALLKGQLERLRRMQQSEEVSR